MRICQPSQCEATTKILNRFPGQFEVSVALWHVFSIEPDQPDPEDSRIIWALAKQHQVQQLDEGYPKSRGEFLCFGLGYPQSDLRSGPFSVAVSVDVQKRSLAVFGPRQYSMLGSPHETGGERSPVAVSSSNAFGGRGFLDNPDGVGWQAKAGDRAPEIEDPDDLIIATRQTVTPAGFWPLSPASSLRKKHLGAFDESWLKSHWPCFPPDTHLEFFQTAPEKQRLSGYFKGNETCEIINMHPLKQRLIFQLPNKRARCIYRRGSDVGIFNGWYESPMVAETLYLFPNEGVAALLHRAVILVHQADALDLRDVLLSLEEPNTDVPAQNKIKQHFQTQLFDVINPVEEAINPQVPDSQASLTS